MLAPRWAVVWPLNSENEWLPYRGPQRFLSCSRSAQKRILLSCPHNGVARQRSKGRGHTTTHRATLQPIGPCYRILARRGTQHIYIYIYVQRIYFLWRIWQWEPTQSACRRGSRCRNKRGALRVSQSCWVGGSGRYNVLYILGVAFREPIHSAIDMTPV